MSLLTFVNPRFVRQELAFAKRHTFSMNDIAVSAKHDVTLCMSSGIVLRLALQYSTTLVYRG